MEIRVTRARRIFSDGKHNAFTGIASFDNQVFVVFRSAASHVSMDGAIKVIASRDRTTWQTVAEAVQPGVDLRDPKVAAFKGKLLVYCGGRTESPGRRSMVLSSLDGRSFGQPEQVKGLPEGLWLWHMAPFGNALYGTAYSKRDRVYEAGLFRSHDGATWEKTADFPIAASEVSIDFDPNGALWALARDDSHGGVPAVCVADPPYTSFRSIKRPPIRLQGPMVKRLAGGCVLVGRRWDSPGRRNLRTDLFWWPDDLDVQFVRSLPSGGDTSYAGWLDVAEGESLISYYSSHEHKMDEPHEQNAVFAKDGAHAEHSTPADIFLADISYA